MVKKATATKVKRLSIRKATIRDLAIGSGEVKGIKGGSGCAVSNATYMPYNTFKCPAGGV